MIVPMYKYAFLVYHSAYKNFLKDIRKLGVVHISTINNEPTNEMQELFRHLTEVDKAVSKLKMLKTESSGKNPGYTRGDEVFDRLKSLEKEMEQNNHQQMQSDKEQKQLLPWGDFDWQKIESLKSQGVIVRFMACPVSKFDPDWKEKRLVEVVTEMEGFCYFVVIEKTGNVITGESSDDFSGAEEIQLPNRSLSEVRDNLKRLNKKAENLQNELHQMAIYCRPLLDQYHREVQQQLDEENAILQTTVEVEGKVKILEGWVPATQKAELDAYLESNQILYTAEKPSPGEKVPILLKNNRFAKLYEVIGDLYDLPNHRELDLVPFFAPFYMMFFGFALGDAGYGLIIIAAAQFMKHKKPALRSILSLAQWLGLSTVIFGILTGTFFGINLIEADIPWLEKVKAYMIDTNQLFNLAIIFGVIQILFGMFLKVINITRMHGFRYALSTIGWLILIIGSGAVYGLKSKEMIEPDVASVIQNALLIVTAVFVLILNHPKRNVFINIGAGLWDTYNMMTGLLGDVLSYIRLFALGISSAILGLVFNNMAMNMKPDHIIFGPLVMIIILVFGHSITIFMSTLGAFVHPIRLTFVEFYKNAGFSGGGKAYNPFAEPASKIKE